MLFNSLVFILIFLPIFLIAYRCAEIYSVKLALWILCAGSLYFYAWYAPPYVFLLIASIIGNFLAAKLILLAPSEGSLRAKISSTAVLFNLLVLGWFKYSVFFADLILQASGMSFDIGQVILPLAISFFTFQQISFLMDVQSGRVKKLDLLTYTSYVCFFPQLIAGPIVRYSELVPQFEKRIAQGRPHTRKVFSDLYIGLCIFALGLAKKVIFADTLAEFSDPVFKLTNAGFDPSMITAWLGAVSFSFQIYFDFSGYSDMAIGLAFMLGFRLPINFNSPYKSRNISDFWQRWHITMTRFFTGTIYINLAVWLTRKFRSYMRFKWAEFLFTAVLPISITFALIGFWHGAGWHYILFGLVHAFYLIVYRFWSDKKLLFPSVPMGPVIPVILTFIAVTVSFVLFRSASLEGAMVYYTNMFDPAKLILPTALSGVLAQFDFIIKPLGVSFGEVPNWEGSRTIIWLLLSGVICFFMPNLPEIFHRFKIVIEKVKLKKVRGRFAHNIASIKYLAVSGLFLIVGIAYFQANPVFVKILPTSYSMAAAMAIFGLVVLISPFKSRLEWRVSRSFGMIAGIVLAFDLIRLFIGSGNAFIYFAF